MGELVRLPINPEKLNPLIRENLSKALAIEPTCYGDLEEFQKENFLAYLLALGNACGLSEKYIDRLVRQHLFAMEAYFNVLLNYQEFQVLLEEVLPGASEQEKRSFLSILVYTHDFGRFVFDDGNLSLTENDALSDALLRVVMPKMFGKKIVNKIFSCLHSIKWITGEKQLPENDEEFTPENKLALILKAIDTLGKATGNAYGELELRHPDTFLAEGGAYDIWLATQVEKGRFPLQANGRIISAEYARKDKELTLRGVNIIRNIVRGEMIEEKTDDPFDIIWLKVNREYQLLFNNSVHFLPQEAGAIKSARDSSYDLVFAGLKMGGNLRKIFRLN